MKKKELQKIREELRHSSNPIEEKYQELSITIILIYPETSGNIGAVARVMKNFGFSRLLLFNPLCEWNTHYVQGFAMHGADVLLSSEVIQCEYSEETIRLKELFQKFDVIIGTTGKGKDYANIKRVPLFIDELDLTTLAKDARIALVFGRESTGLSNDQLALMDFCVRIPADPVYPILNLSHAVGICLFTLFKKLRDNQIFRGEILPASKEDKDRLMGEIEDTLSQLALRSNSQESTLSAFRNIIGRAFISKKEATLMFGMFKKMNRNVCISESAAQVQLEKSEEGKKS
jgi:TrmH family RNA methyltransferase